MSTEGQTSGWRVVLGPDGTVLAALGGAPRHWIGNRLESQGDAPVQLREQAREIVSELHGLGRPVVAAPPCQLAAPGTSTVALEAIEAVPVRREPTDVRSLLDSTIALFADQAAALDITVTSAVQRGFPALLAIDAEKVAWTIAALVGNALRYVRRGTRLMPGGRVVIAGTYDAITARLTLEVTDDGCGIPQERLPRLLERGSAAGLSLMLVRDVVVAHGGRVEILSSTDRLDHGTKVRMTFPAR